MDGEQIYEVVMKLVGSVDPVGDSTIDSQRYGNLLLLEDVTNSLIDHILDLIPNKDSYEGSVHDVGEEAQKWALFWEEEFKYAARGE